MVQFLDDCDPSPAPDQSADAAADPFVSRPGHFDTAPRPPTFNSRQTFQGFLPGSAVSELEASQMSGQGLELGPTPVAPHPLTFVFLLAIGWAVFGR